MAFTPKPMRGTALLERRDRRAVLVRHERREMESAKRRDGNICRWPSCVYKSKKLPIDACHATHRGAGGNPKGDRTTRDQVIALCRAHHGLWDTGEIEIEPLTEDGFDGPASFFEQSEAGRMVHVASETRIGVSVARS